MQELNLRTVDYAHRWSTVFNRPSSPVSSKFSLLSVAIFGDGGRWVLGIRKPLAITIIQIQVHLVPVILHLR